LFVLGLDMLHSRKGAEKGKSRMGFVPSGIRIPFSVKIANSELQK
jgi:hypothetical protein